MKILVAGGAGYIGRHLAVKLAEAGHEAVIFDNLATGNDDLLPPGRFVRGDLGDRPLLNTILRAGSVDAVCDCVGAGNGACASSDPLAIYRRGYVPFLTLVEACVSAGIGSYVYVSTADLAAATEAGLDVGAGAVREPRHLVARVAGMAEQTLGDVSRTGGMRSVVLRVPVVAGADPNMGNGESRERPLHVIGRAVQVAVGRKALLRVPGGLATKDGSPLRDYVHVDDLAEAQVRSLEYLAGGGESRVFACGYGRGYSDRAVAEKVRKLSGLEFPIEEEAAADGGFPEPPVDDAGETKATLGWAPRYDDGLSSIIKTALRWERKVERKVIAAVP